MNFIKPSLILSIFLILISCSKEAEIVVQYKLTVSASPSVGGTITPGSSSYNKGQIVNLLATPSAEYVFKDWSGSLSGTTNPSPVTMDIDKSVVGNFEKRQYPLTLTIEGQGTVKEEIAVVAPQSQYPSGTTVKLTAQPGTNYEFKEWSGDLSSTVNPFSIVVNKSINLKVIFVYSDKDGDGVFDIKDKCPSTIKGETVDSTGCSKSQIDTDKDGIFDNKDKCPSTIKGEAVDSTGCSKSQIDSDKDGIFDNKDKCPNTPKGEVVDSNGCSKSQIDTDGDGIPDSKDMDNKTRKGVPVDANGVMLNPIYLDKNGVTIKAYDWAIVGDKGIINNIEYKVVNIGELSDMIKKGEDYSKVCTTFIYSMNWLFYLKYIRYDISSWDIRNVRELGKTFERSLNIGDLSNWDTSNVWSMENTFFGAEVNFDLSKWNVSKVSYMYAMFANGKMNSDISKWDVANVGNFAYMFSNCSNFNQDISLWNVSKATVMDSMFYNCLDFNQDLSKWNVKNVTSMKFMFLNCLKFNSNISNWDVRIVSNMRDMFSGAQSFNQNLSNWNVSNVGFCSNFNYNTNSWSLPKPNFTICKP
jgi:surface protein